MGVSPENKERQKTNPFVQKSKGFCQHSNRSPTQQIRRSRKQIRHSRNHHSLTFQTPTARTDIYKGSFFSKTNSDWDALPDLILFPLLKEQRILWLGESYRD